MAKGKKGDSKSKASDKAASKAAEEPPPPPLIELRTIKINVDYIEHVDPRFHATDVYIEVKHSNNVIGQSEKKYVLDKKYVSLDYELEYAYNIAPPEELDKLATNPFYFLVWQSFNKDELLYLPMLAEIHETVKKEEGEILSEYEGILGVKPKAVTEKKAGKVKVKDQGKGSKGSKGSKASKASKGSGGKKDAKGKSEKASKASKRGKSPAAKTSPSATSSEELGPICVGGGTIDLLPFLKGETNIEETVSIYQSQFFTDERFKHGAICPQLKVKVTMDEPIFTEESDKKLFNLFQLTVEAVYNLPAYINENFEYKVATVYPSQTLKLASICFENGAYKNENESVGQIKLWPNLSTNPDDLGAQTKYIIDPDSKTIKNKIGLNLKETVDAKTSKIVWNNMKQTWLTEDANDYLRKLITLFRNWPVEISLIPKASVKKAGAAEGKKGKKDKSSGSSKGSKTKGGKSNASLEEKSKTNVGNNIHLMVFADISNLLYPGVTKTRVACEIRTFQQKEFTKATGFENSYFAPIEIIPESPVKPAKGGGEKGQGDGSKKDDKASKKSKDSKKGGKKEAKGKAASPAEAKVEPEPEPSQKLVNSSGKSTFIIIDAELMNPFQKSRTIEDLTKELLNLIPKRPPIPKSSVPIRLANDFYQHTIGELIREINKEYQNYSVDYEQYKKPKTTHCFIKFLQSKGTYQNFLVTIARAIAMLVKEKFKFNPENQTEYMFDNYISMIYVYLINEMNKQINNVVGCSINSCLSKRPVPKDYLYLCDEAVQLEMPLLAEKYHLQIIKENTRSPDHWLHLAIFYKRQNLFDRSFESCKEVIALKANHKYGLMLFGGLLFEKKEYVLAETTFLSVVNYYPNCIEAWVALYVVYYAKTRFEGCDICLENIKKYEEEMKNPNNDQKKKSDATLSASETEEDIDNIKDYEPLGWSTTIAKDTPFFQSCLLFMKLGALQIAEQALLFDKINQTGAHKYYFGVIEFLKKNYKQCLSYLHKAQKLHGPDYAVNSMLGHCNYRLGNYEDAKEAYEFIVSAYNRPEDMHTVYINLALIHEREMDFLTARKYMLLVCKLSPTPYSWLLLGIIYFKLEELENAEACVTESNFLDNRLPENWAYLVLINLKLGRIWEARQCYSQMTKFELHDKSLLTTVMLQIKTANDNSNC